MGLRQRLLWMLLAPLALITPVGLIGDYWSAVEPTRDAYDFALADAAVAVAAHVTRRDGHPVLELTAQAEALLRADQLDRVYYRVSGPDGALLAGDAGLPGVDSMPENPAFFDSRYNGTPVRVVAYRAQTAFGPVTIEVGETLRKRERAAARIVSALLWPALINMLVTLVVVVLGVRFGLRPLLDLSRDIEGRSSRDLRALPERAQPRELRPLVHALNRLLGWLRASSEAQQRFLADAAHQLRTPLAGFQTQLELVARDDLPTATRARLAQLLEGSRRIAHLANQLLALARAAPEASLGQAMRSVDLRLAAENAAADFLDRAIAKGIDLGVEAQAAQIRGSDWLIRELIANLADNAIRYSPHGSRVTLRVGLAADAAFVEVEDDGPGIPAEARSQIFERFYRMPGTVGEGCGLGLSIVRDIADAHDARIEIHAAGGGPGTRVRVLFSPVPATMPSTRAAG